MRFLTLHQQPKIFVMFTLGFKPSAINSLATYTLKRVLMEARAVPAVEPQAAKARRRMTATKLKQSDGRAPACLSYSQAATDGCVPTRITRSVLSWR